MITNIFILAAAIFLIIKGATFATTYAVRFAENFNIAKYIIGLIVVAVISIMPETFIAINSVIANVPELGLGTLFGSNVSDLTLVFGLIVILSGRRSIKVDSKILKLNIVYPFLLMVPIILGLDGHYGRIEGLTLIIIGGIFYYFSFKRGLNEPVATRKEGNRKKNLLFLIGSIALLLVGSHFTVTSGVAIANDLHISPILIGILVIGVGTTMPELIFSIKAARQYEDSLAVGDILGSVLADATIVIGILALISPIDFNKNIIYITGICMLLAGGLIVYFMHTGKEITKKEAIVLFVFWILCIMIEYLVNR